VRKAPAIWLLLATVAFCGSLVGCSGENPAFVDAGASYDSASALELPRSVDAGRLVDQPTSKAADLRHEALVALRKRGGAAADAAVLITRTFPAGSNSVPFYVESADFEGQPAWIIVEAIGRTDDNLTDKRVWVLSAKGDVLLAGTR